MDAGPHSKRERGGGEPVARRGAEETMRERVGACDWRVGERRCARDISETEHRAAASGEGGARVCAVCVC